LTEIKCILEDIYLNEIKNKKWLQSERRTNALHFFTSLQPTQ